LDLGALVDRVFALSDLAPSTKKTYQMAARHFVSWAGSRPLTTAILVEYKSALRNRTDLSAKTKNLYLAAIRTVFRRLFELGSLPVDFSKTVRSFKTNGGHKRAPISDAQVEAAFAYATKKKDHRLLLILNLLYRQGLRQKEVVDIDVEHFDEDAATLSILGKARDDRETINLHPLTVRALADYLRENELKAGPIFASRKKQGEHLTTNMLYRLVRDLHRRCGIKNSPHGWRKVFASRLIESGMNLLDVQSYTRHKSVEQLKVYYDRISIQRTLPEYYKTFAMG
jgi:site-specific recombinase XerD